MKETSAAERTEGDTKIKSFAKKSLGFIISVGLIALLLNSFRYGVLAFVGAILLLSLWRMWKMRDMFMTQMRYLESIIWGKPLDKEMWDKGEFKNRPKRKVKIVWKKKNKSQK